MTYAILANGAITAHGSAADLWPNTSFSGNGPNAAFLTAHDAQQIRSDAPYDQATQYLQSCDPYVLNGEVFNTIAVPIPTPPPEPAWDQFSLTALADPGLNIAVLVADPTVPNAARGLSAALLEVKLQGEYVNFAACWSTVVAAAQIPPSRVAALVALAQTCHLPQAFINVISPP